MDDLSRPLGGHPFLNGLDDEMVKTLVGCARNVRYAAGEFLMREGDVANTFFLIRKGRVALEVHQPAKAAARVETAGPGDLVGLSWLLPIIEHTGENRTALARTHLDARALDDVVAFSLDGECLRNKMQADPKLGYALCKRLLATIIQRLERVRLQRLDIYDNG